MPVDLAALKKIAEGDPNTKVMVSRRWLAEVHRLLSEAEAAKAAKPKPRTGGDAVNDMLRGMCGSRWP